jgi:hypothetical protein
MTNAYIPQTAVSEAMEAIMEELRSTMIEGITMRFPKKIELDPQCVRDFQNEAGYTKMKLFEARDFGTLTMSGVGIGTVRDVSFEVHDINPEGWYPPPRRGGTMFNAHDA